MLSLDDCTRLSSPLHRWEVRPKLLGIFSLIFTFASVHTLSLLPVMAGITLSLVALSRLPLPTLITRLRYPGAFLLSVILALPFFSGQTELWRWGAVALHLEGCLQAVMITGRFLCIFTLSVILLGTTSFPQLVQGMRSLGLPPLLTDMALLTYRYLVEIGQELNTMQQAMYLRGYQSHQQGSWRIMRLAALAGTLLIRSYERSERVYQAMRLRGYGQVSPSSSWVPCLQMNWSWGCLGSVLLLSGSLLLANSRLGP